MIKRARNLVFWIAIVSSAQVQPQATVHIYRYKLTVATAAHPTVSCDLVPVVRIQNGRVYALKVSPGRHSFATADSHAGVDVDAEPGKDYFVRIDYPPNTSFARHASPVLVPPEEGRMEIRKLRPLDKWYIENATCGKP